MSVPRNNLDDVLRRRGQHPTILPEPNSRHPNTSKFKPAAASSRKSSSSLHFKLLTRPLVRKNTLGSLPSFSTPGFHKPKPQDTTVPLPKSVKRASSDSSVLSEHSPSSKRAKTASNKENSNAPPKDKGKARLNDEPWMEMVLDEEPNPFARLDRDYPQHAAASGSSNPVAQNHSDLNSVRPILQYQSFIYIHALVEIPRRPQNSPMHRLRL
jgi:hypothetical protein